MKKKVFPVGMLKQIQIIKRLEVLQESYIPEKLFFLENQIKDLGLYLGYAISENIPPHTLIIGTKGTGKTSLVLKGIQELRDYVRKRNLKIRIGFAHAPSSAYSAITSIALDTGIKIPDQGLSFEKSIERYEEHIKNHISIFVIDEIDKIRDIDDFILQLAKRNAKNTKVKGYCIIGLTNKKDFVTSLSRTNYSSFKPRIITTFAYNAKQLLEIFSHRTKLAFYENRIQNGVLELVSALTANVGKGDCRFGLDILLRAAEEAEKDNAELITAEYIEKARKLIEFKYVDDLIKKFPTVSKLLLLKTALEKKIQIGLLYKWFNDVHGDLKLTERRLRSYLADLEDETFIMRSSESKESRGRENYVSLLNLDSDQVIFSLCKDDSLLNSFMTLPKSETDKIHEVLKTYKINN